MSTLTWRSQAAIEKGPSSTAGMTRIAGASRQTSTIGPVRFVTASPQPQTLTFTGTLTTAAGVHPAAHQRRTREED